MTVMEKMFMDLGYLTREAAPLRKLKSEKARKVKGNLLKRLNNIKSDNEILEFYIQNIVGLTHLSSGNIK
jgi:hypothetical protein